MSDGARNSWREVRDHVRGRILDSTYRPGDRLPRDEDIARDLNCARSTVNRAMQSLAEDGLVERRRRGGTTVNPDPVTRTTLDIPITRIEIERRGHAYHHHLIDAEEKPAPATVCARFGVVGACPALRIRALHLADGRPYMLEDRWICLATVPEIRDVDFSLTSANEWLVRNRPFSRCEVHIYAHPIDAPEAAHMETSQGSAMLVLERTTWIDDDAITHVKATHAPGHRLVTAG